MTHVLGWQDDRTANVETCEETRLPPERQFLVTADEPRRCPVCLRWLLLKWDVEAVPIGEVEEIVGRPLEQRLEAARLTLRKLLDERAQADATWGVYRCAVCRENVVDVDAGEDTCRACLARV